MTISLFPAGDLAERFVGRDSGGGGKIERTQRFRRLGNFDFAVGADKLVKPFWRAVAFVPEDKSVAVAKIRVPKRFFRLCRKQPQPRGARREREKRVPVFVVHDVERLPIIHSRTAQVRIGNRESERVNQMQAGTRNRAHSADVSGVLRNLRIEKNKVKHFFESLWFRVDSALRAC